ncbi:MAG: proteasome accessory factor PafA2 family protein [Opitutus sp.]
MSSSFMQIQFGLETEYGITRERAENIDVVEEAIAVVRSAHAPGVRDRWDYRQEDPHQDARGFRVKALQQDADEASYFGQDAKRQLSFTELKSDLVLKNGARLYNDHTHPEYCTPECTTPREVLQQDWAGDSLVMDCAVAATGESDNPVRLYKNNTDFLGHSYGCHENYLLPRSLAWSRLAEGMQAFLATRQIFCGAGKYGWEAEDRFLQPGFQIAQRSDFFVALQGVETMRERPIINTRDEPHADPAKYRRFHVIIGDANLSPFATYLKVGTTALVLQAMANGAPMEALPKLADAVGALTQISHDLSWKWRVESVGGKQTSAIDVQRAYLGWVRTYSPPVDAEWAAVAAAWGEVLDDLERDPLSTADRLDWSAKFRLIEQFREAEKLAADDPWLRSLDLTYHLLDRSQGLYYGLLDSEAFRLPYALKEISGHELRAPETTRAALRGGCIEKFGSLVESAQWDGVLLNDTHRRIELDLRDVFSPERIAQGREVLAAARSPADLLSLPFAKLR